MDRVGGENSRLDKIIKLTKNLSQVAKISPLRKCCEIAVDELIGNNKISKHCAELGITKKEYIDFIMKNL